VFNLTARFYLACGYRGYLSAHLFACVTGDGSFCAPGMFRCPEGKCIPSLWVCNYQKDCEKGEDEFQACRK
jgi:hypothetical protein